MCLRYNGYMGDTIEYSTVYRRNFNPPEPHFQQKSYESVNQSRFFLHLIKIQYIPDISSTQSLRLVELCHTLLPDTFYNLRFLLCQDFNPLPCLPEERKKENWQGCHICSICKQHSPSLMT